MSVGLVFGYGIGVSRVSGALNRDSLSIQPPLLPDFLYLGAVLAQRVRWGWGYVTNHFDDPS